MKISISLPDDDVAIVDAYVEQSGLPSRSAAIHKAIQMLRHPDLEDSYADAWDEWSSADEGGAWDSTVGDGVADAAR